MQKLTPAQRLSRERDLERQTLEAAERLRFSVAFAQSGLQALTLINGGALVALFTFVGSATALKFNFHAMWLAFACFAAALVFTMIAYLGAHLSQDQFHVSSLHGAWQLEQQLTDVAETYDPVPAYRIGTISQIIAIGASLLALAGFIAGAGFALSGALGR